MHAAFPNARLSLYSDPVASMPRKLGKQHTHCRFLFIAGNFAAIVSVLPLQFFFTMFIRDLADIMLRTALGALAVSALAVLAARFVAM